MFSIDCGEVRLVIQQIPGYNEVVLAEGVVQWSSPEVIVKGVDNASFP